MPVMDRELLAFCQREQPRLVGRLRAYCGDRDVAEELAQEAVLRAVDRWPQVQRMAAPGAWLHRVGVNLAHSWFRRRHAEGRAYHRHGPQAEPALPPPTAEQLTMREAVATLPRRERTVVVLRYYEQLSVAETARHLGCPPGTVKSLTHRALKRLKGQLVEREPVGWNAAA